MSSYYGDRGRDIPSWDSLERGDDDEIVQAEYAYAARDHILFCIDASSSMQVPQADEETPDGTVRGRSPLHQVLEAVVKIEKSKVITGPADSVGLLVYNIDPDKISSSSSGNYKPGTFVYQQLKTINAEEIKRIIKLMETANEQWTNSEEEDNVQPEVISGTFPACKEGEELNIADVLVTCNFIFRDAGSKMGGNKRVFLVTDNDDPPGATNRQPARTVFSDLETYGITINTFFIDRPDHRFNAKKYWNDILGIASDDESSNETVPTGLEKLEDLMQDLVIKQAPKRVQFSIPLNFGGKDGDIEIGVSGYALVSEQGKGQPKYVRMRGQTVEEVLTKSEYTSAETGAVLRDEEIGYAYQFGNENTVKNILEPNWWESNEQQQHNQMAADEILRLDEERRRREEEEADEPMEQIGPGGGEKTDGKVRIDSDIKPKVVAKTRLRFTDEEVAQFKSMGISPQIKILGFQSPSNLDFDQNIKHSYFIYPDESTYTGSTRTFAALLKSCIKLNRHALALCRLRRNTGPEFAVLIPQEETFGRDGGQEDPPGFHVIILPFADDIRSQPKNITDNLLATEQQAKLFVNIIKRLRTKTGQYNSDAHPNPALAYHYAQLQALAFEEDFDPATTDLDRTKPKYHGVHKAAGEFMREWNKAIEEDERAVAGPPAKAGTKRAAINVADLKEGDLVDVRGYWLKGTMSKVGLGASTVPMSGRQGTDQMWLREVETCRSVESAVTDVQLKVAEMKDWALFNKVPLPDRALKADLIEAISKHLEKDGGGKKSKK